MSFLSIVGAFVRIEPTYRWPTKGAIALFGCMVDMKGPPIPVDNPNIIARDCFFDGGTSMVEGWEIERERLGEPWVVLR